MYSITSGDGRRSSAPGSHLRQDGASSIAEALPWIRPRGGGFEVRAIRADGRGAYSAQFPPAAPDEEVASYIRDQDCDAVSGVYYGLNPRRPSLKPNQAGGDADVERRALLLIDIDAVRPPDSNSTEGEREAARGLASAVREHLRGRGWPEPLAIDSGNGRHLIYPVDLPNDGRQGEAARLVRGALQALAARFDAPGARVDAQIFDAARIARMPGTRNRKGPDEPDRPRRMARVLEFPPGSPEQWGAVPRRLIEGLAAEAAPSNGQAKGSIWDFRASRDSPDGRDPGRRSAVQRASAWLAKADPAISGQNGHGTTFRVACSVGPGFDLTPEECFNLLWCEYNPRCIPPWSEPEIGHKVEDAYEEEPRRGWLLDRESQGSGGSPRGGASPRGLDGTAGPDRPIIDLQSENHEVIGLAVAALARQPDVFQRGGGLVRIVEHPNGGTMAALLPPAEPRIEGHTAMSLVEKLSEAAEWGVWKKAKSGREAWAPKHPPRAIAEEVLDRRHYPGIRPLGGIVGAPTILRGGRILDREGYDPESQLYYRKVEEFPAVPDRPTRDDAIEAAGRLLGLVDDIPFAERVQATVFLAHLLTLVGRHSIAGCTPIFVYDASTAGSGKTLLVAVAFLIALGRMSPASPVPEEAEEARKFITATALAGTAAINLDNAATGSPLGNHNLDAVLTSTHWSDRVLGASRQVSVPWTTVLSATGNNIVFRGDLGRRAVICRLESRVERPEDRTDFRIPDLQGHVRENRGAYMRDALTILRAHALAGYPRPEGIPRMGSFESWDDAVRAAILWMGLPDPLANARAVREEDPEVLLGNALVQGLHSLPGMISRGRTGPEILKEIESDPAHEDLRYALMSSVSREEGKLPTSKLFGKALSRLKGRTFQGRRIAQNGYWKNSVLWKIEQDPDPVSLVALVSSSPPIPCKKQQSENRIWGETNSPKQPNSPAIGSAPLDGWQEEGRWTS